MYLKMTIKDKQKRKGQEPLLSEDKYESTNLWLLKLKVDLIMKKVYSSEKSDRYINRHIVSDDRRENFRSNLIT